MDNQDNQPGFSPGFYIIDRMLLQYLFDKEPSLLKKINRGYYVLKINKQMWAIPLRTNSKYTQFRYLDYDSAIPLIGETILISGFHFRNKNEELYYLESEAILISEFKNVLEKRTQIDQENRLLELQKEFYKGVM